MLSNFGQNFKTDIFYSNNVLGYSNELSSIWSESKNHQDYIDKSSNYILENLKSNNLLPFLNDSYTEEWTSNLPTFKYKSSLEVISIYGRIVKKYNYGSDFFEDFRGSVKSGVLKGKAMYMENIGSTPESIREIVLFEGYRNKSLDDIKNIDSALRSIGASYVISPSYSGDLNYESNLYEPISSMDSNGLAKLLTSRETFNELKSFSKKGYTIRIKCGGEIKPVTSKNIYGVMKGKNTSYRPLIIAFFYDGIVKTPDADISRFQHYATPPSMALECIKSLKLQRARYPDRTIIFAFLSNKAYGKEGLNKLLMHNPDGDIILFDGIGTNTSYSLSYSKPSKTLADTIEYYINKNAMKAVSKNIDMSFDKSMITISTNELPDTPFFSHQSIYNSGKFLLSLIGDECYNLDILSGNIREIRVFKRFVRNNSVLLSLFALISLVFVVFKKPSIKKN